MYSANSVGHIEPKYGFSKQSKISLKFSNIKF